MGMDDDCRHAYIGNDSQLDQGCPMQSNESSSRGVHEEKPYLLGPERRCGVSDLELAAAMLAHAVSYLIGEQLVGRRFPPQANREAVQILCQAAEAVESIERREPARRLIAAWIRKTHREPRLPQS